MLKLSRRKLAQYASTRLLAGDSVSTVMDELGAYLIDSRRMREAELIVRDIESALAAKGLIVATVTSARVLSSDTKRSLTDYVAAFHASTKTVELREQIDESVIGGVKIEIPGAELDATVKSKLEKLTLHQLI